MGVWQWVGTVLISLAVAWAALVLALLAASRRGPDRLGWREMLALVPDVVRLVRRLAGDSRVPGRVRLVLWLGLGYLLSPIDLVPDFLPLIGYADDAIVVVLLVRTVVRAAGLDAVRDSWTGSNPGLAALLRLSGVGEPA